MADLIRKTVNDDQNACTNPIPYIAEAAQTGKVVIIFTRQLQVASPQIDLKTLEYEFEPDVWKPVFTV